jgi:Holliday junction resolvasome RuvABC ATP-dependent DNA helicase subunit
MRIEDINNEVIGQDIIVEELKGILNSIINDDRNYNLLIVGGSGMGKSYLLKIIANIFGVRNCLSYDPENILFESSLRFHFIDEVHLLENPEKLYNLLDSNEFTFIFATNEYGKIKEPLLNRCITLVLNPYTENDLIEMAKYYLNLEGFYSLDSEIYKSISAVSRDNPRRLIEIVRRLSIIFRESGIPNNINSLDYLLMSIGVDPKTGFTLWDRQYLEFLSSVGNASLNTISYSTGIDKSFITKYIEPFLIKNNYIRITHKGRVICQES